MVVEYQSQEVIIRMPTTSVSPELIKVMVDYFQILNELSTNDLQQKLEILKAYNAIFLEYLAQKAQIPHEVEELGEDLKADWWAKIKLHF